MAKFIVNELLMCAISKYDTDNIVDIKNVINTFYCEEAVNDAKTELWTNYADKLDRIVNRRSKVKKSKTLLMLYSLYQQYIRKRRNFQ